MSSKALRRSSLVVALASGCSFDAEGYGPHRGSVAESSGDDGDASDGGAAPASDDANVDGGAADDRGDEAGDSRTGTTVPSDGGEASGGPSDDGSALDAGAQESSSSAAGSDSGDVEGPTCPAEVFALMWAADAEVAEPMQLVPTDANMDPDVAASAIAESGTVTFAIDFACPGEYALWGLVWDYAPGAYGTDDPDSFYVGLGGSEDTWRYGCQTGELASGLSWQRVQALSAQPCDASPLVVDVAAAGTVELQFRNREAGDGSSVAGIAAIVVASDPTADPSALYMPY